MVETNFEKFIETSEKIGFELATIETEKGQQRIENVRNNQRIIFTDFELANSIWQTLKEFAPKQIGNSIAIGLNEMFRFYKYQPGQEFKNTETKALLEMKMKLVISHL